MGPMTSTAGLVKMKLIKQQNWRERVIRGCSFQMINLLTWHHTSRISDTIQFIHPHGLMFSLPLYSQTTRSHKPLDLYDSIRKYRRELWVIVFPRIFTQKIAWWSHDLIHHSFTWYLECFFHLWFFGCLCYSSRGEIEIGLLRSYHKFLVLFWAILHVVPNK